MGPFTLLLSSINPGGAASGAPRSSGGGGGRWKSYPPPARWVGRKKKTATRQGRGRH